MRPLHSSLYLCLIIGTGFCAYPSSPDRPVSGGHGNSTVRQLKEGITGRITNDDGNAVEGAAVLAAPLDPSGPATPEIAIVSDVNGRYQWPLRASRYELTVVAEGYQRVSKKVAVSAGEVATLDFVLSRERRAHAPRDSVDSQASTGGQNVDQTGHRIPISQPGDSGGAPPR